ncbi:flagellar hook-basal body complex protein [Candidatus Contubernalis alkaliaceticus]|uniref:flagellar hook-basal body complex protein n=1 Tax=Candidatus Contubernalis alkaliaceticus TaxID=338645 RepID=UPI001F4C25DE|nr:flagellar hook-basal body complex protein [Candidatus Contubernalis alkalaceticus]UNC91751.1 flagellar hook-basal body complex protein [Candidatus Contubernalis alkalaceticus]
MQRSLFTAISGLTNHQTKLDVIGNNIANVNTTAFKSSSVRFQDILNQTLTGATVPQDNRGGTNPIQVGQGMQVASISTDYSDGSPINTGRDTDLSIQGSGFFIVNDGTRDLYTRDGSFSLDADGTLVNSSGYRVMGFGVDQFGRIDESITVPLNIPIGYKADAWATGEIIFGGNLNANSTIGDTYALRMNIYDSLGGLHGIDVVFTKVGTNLWNWEVPEPGGILTGTGSGTIRFDNNGSVESVVSGQNDSVNTALIGMGSDAAAASVTGADPANTGTVLRAVAASVTGAGPANTGTDLTGLDATTTITIDGAVYTLDMSGWDGTGDLDALAAFLGTADNGGIALSTAATINHDGSNITISSNDPDALNREVTIIHAGVDALVAEALTGLADGLTHAGTAAKDATTTITIDGVGYTLDMSGWDGTGNLDALIAFLGTADNGGTALSTAATINHDGSNITISSNDPGAANREVTITHAGADALDAAALTGMVHNLADYGVNALPALGTITFNNVPEEGSVVLVGDVNVGFWDSGSNMFEDASAAREALGVAHLFDTRDFNNAEAVKNAIIALDGVIPNWNLTDNGAGQVAITAAVGGANPIPFVSAGIYSQGGISTVSLTGVGINDLDINLDFTYMSQLVGNTTALLRSQDGYPEGILNSFNIDNLGIVTGAYSNGMVGVLGQIALCRFENPEGLNKMGSNLYLPSANSGLAQVGAPGVQGRGSIRSSSLEMSNVNLAFEFTEMITTSRAFQANSRVISSSDELLQEVVNLKR